MSNSIRAAAAVASIVVSSAVMAGEGWVVRAYGDNAFVNRGGLWTNRADRVMFDANRMPRPAKPVGMSFLARTGFVTDSTGRHAFGLKVAARDRMGHLVVVDGRHVMEFPNGLELGAGRHTLAVYLRGSPRGTPGLPWVDFSVEMDGQPLKGLSFDVADEKAEAVVYDRVFAMADGKRVWRNARGTRGSDPNGGVGVVGVRQAKLGMDY